MEEKRDRCLKPIDIAVVSGVSVTITVPEVFLRDGKCFDLLFCLHEPDRVKFCDLIEGNEVVTIQNGVGGISYVLEDKNGDTFYADLLRLGFCYVLRFGNNGPSIQTGQVSGIAHFINLNTPCCARRFNPANTTIPPIVETTEGV